LFSLIPGAVIFSTKCHNELVISLLKTIKYNNIQGKYFNKSSLMN